MYFYVGHDVPYQIVVLSFVANTYMYVDKYTYAMHYTRSTHGQHGHIKPS